MSFSHSIAERGVTSAPLIEGNMTESKHTPGPWYTDGHRIATNEQNIAFLTNCEEREANARLIAMAPYLLSALERLVREVDSGEPVHLGKYDFIRQVLWQIRGKS